MIISGVHAGALRHLVEVVHALQRLGAGFGTGERRQQHGRQNRYDGYHHQQFDEGEAMPWGRGVDLVTFFHIAYFLKFDSVFSVATKIILRPHLGLVNRMFITG
jgi:hypothetical protein